MKNPSGVRVEGCGDSGLPQLCKAVRACTVCSAHLPLGPRPIFQLHPYARILIVGQAPGRRAHEKGIAFADASGDRLRQWMGVDQTIFYDPKRVALLPMGFCYPGTGQSGDLPPRPECAPTWRDSLTAHLGKLDLTLLIGQYAQQYYLGRQGGTLTELVRNWQQYAPHYVPLPHPSPRNNLWLRKNFWFERDLIPELQARIQVILNTKQS